MKNARILVCDDEEGIRASLDLVLGKDHRLTFASDGEEAITKAGEQAFDLALVDIKMPRVNGLEVLKWFRQHQPGVPVLMLTAYQSVEMAQEAIALGATDYLAKPFERAEFKKTIERILAESSTVKKV